MSLPHAAQTRDPTPSPIEVEEKRLQRLRQWCDTSGVRFHSTQVLFHNNQRGLYATSDINNGDTIITIPRSAAIIADIFAGTSPALSVFRDIELSFWNTASWEIRLAVLLLDECVRGSYSPFNSYLEALPPNPWSALWAYQTFGRKKSFAQLRPYKMHHVADSYRAYVKSIFVAFQKALPTAIRGQVSLRQFSWAVCICQSRAFGVPTGATENYSEQDNPVDSGKHFSVPFRKKGDMVPVRYALFPGLDMANHSVHRQTSIKYDPASDQYNVVSGANFAAGQEIFLSYGLKSNEDLMFFYSFVEGDNPANTVRITDFQEWISDLAYSKHGSDHDRYAQLHPLLQRKISTDDLCEFHQSGVSDNLMQLLRLALTKSEDLTSLLTELETNPNRLAKPLNLENELSCWHAIDEKSQQLLEDLGEFTEEEEQRLTKMYSSRPCSAIWRWCEPGSDGELMYRYERQTILDATSKRVRHFARISSAVGRVCTVLMPPTQSLIKMDIFNDKEDKGISGIHKFFISPEDLNVA